MSPSNHVKMGTYSAQTSRSFFGIHKSQIGCTNLVLVLWLTSVSVPCTKTTYIVYFISYPLREYFLLHNVLLFIQCVWPEWRHSVCRRCLLHKPSRHWCKPHLLLSRRNLLLYPHFSSWGQLDMLLIHVCYPPHGPKMILNIFSSYTHTYIYSTSSLFRKFKGCFCGEMVKVEQDKLENRRQEVYICWEK